MNGLLVVDKPSDMTSRDLVNIVIKKLNTKKIGHTGTLDPIATGCLVLAVGDALKVIEFINHNTKEYIAKAKIGMLTDTLDVTGNILKKVDYSLDKDKLKEVILSFVGKYEQEVPLYSSVKVNGLRLYKYARDGKEVELPKREVEIYSIDIIDISDDSFTFKCSVSKGTYIRSLIRDIGDKIGIPCSMESLRRTKEGLFNIEESIKLDDIDDNIKFIPVSRVFKDYFIVEVDNYIENKIKNGRVLDNLYDKDEIVFINSEGEVLAIYRVDTSNINKIKPYKVLKHN